MKNKEKIAYFLEFGKEKISQNKTLAVSKKT